MKNFQDIIEYAQSFILPEIPDYLNNIFINLC
jgi:hypothetical protein